MQSTWNQWWWHKVVWKGLKRLHFSHELKHVTGTRWSANPNQGRSHSPHNFRSSHEYLIHYQSEDSHVTSLTSCPTDCLISPSHSSELKPEQEVGSIFSLKVWIYIIIRDVHMFRYWRVPFPMKSDLYNGWKMLWWWCVLCRSHSVLIAWFGVSGSLRMDSLL
jgi:hypothetical protein